MRTDTDPPSPTLPTAEWLARCKTVFNNGEFFRSFDIAQAGLREYPSDVPLAHIAVLSLANSGAVAMAAEQFEKLGLEWIDSFEILSLRGRLAKDRGHGARGEARRRALAEASAWYECAEARARAMGRPDAYYPAVNAGFLALLAGHESRSAERGRDVLALLGPRIEEARAGNPPDRYWVLASAIEAYLLTDDIAAAQSLVPDAVAASASSPAELSATWRQLEYILNAKGLKHDTLLGLAPAEVVHYLGHIIAPKGRPGRFEAGEEATTTEAIERALDGFRAGVAYGALAAGADIMLAEALLRRGATLHVVLPFARDDFVRFSVLSSGQAWLARFDACMQAATSVRYATEDQYLGDDHLFTYGSQLAMGLAVLYARHLHANLRQIAIWNGQASVDTIASTTVDMHAWHRAGLPQSIIRVGAGERTDLPPYASPPPLAPAPSSGRLSRAMLFGDICGFSKLTDAQLPNFTSQVMGALGAVIARFGGHTDMVNTWGDGIFVVFSDAGIAAQCALDMQQAMQAIDLPSAGLPPHLSLRLGGHLGPVYELTDPILGRPNVYGAHVSRAARIEPIVPTGCVYVTETFAAVLALANADSLACDYVGWTDMAKHFGRLRMFLLRRRDGRLEPTVVSDIERAPVPPDSTVPVA